MTQIRRLTDGTRRPGVLGVHSLDHFSMTVPNLEQARHFYQSSGLDVREEGRGLALYAPGLEHRWGILNQGQSKKLHYLSFGAFEDDLPRFRDRLSVLHVERLAPPPGFESNGLWFHDHNGVLVEIRVAEKSSPNEKSSFTAYSAPAGVQGTSYRRNAPPTRPRRLAHLALYTADVGRAIGFYRDVLGLRLSDSSEGNVAFMHGPHGSDHHMVAFARSAGPGLHHCSWDVGAVQEIGLGAADGRQRLRRRLGARPSRPGLELLPLCARSLGQLFRIFHRHGLHPRRSRLAVRRPSGRGLFLPVGPKSARGLRAQLRNRDVTRQPPLIPAQAGNQWR
jgi:catechol 2,3-dioxygenase-like lactoylglutathione lyase family enzyme